MGGNELAFVQQAFDENWIAPVGPHIGKFEEEMERYLGGGHCVALSSGTAALHLALRLSGVGPGDEVLCSDLTFIASVSPVVMQGAKPVFVDADPATWNLDLGLVEELLAERASKGQPMPKAIIPVHLYGQPVDMDSVMRLAEQYGMAVVEDAAESLGATHGDTHTGLFGAMGALSFNGNKIITCAGGGMFLARDKALADKARFLSTQARDDAPHYQHSTVGYNYRMSNVQAGIGRGQMEVLDQRVEQKRAIFDGYVERLGDLDAMAFMPEVPGGRCNRWLTCVLFGGDDESGYELREAVRLALEAENIESRPLWKPMHMQPVFAEEAFVGSGAGESLFARGLCLPSDTKLTAEDMDRICAVVRETVDKRG